jgi:hypothetical protein
MAPPTLGGASFARSNMSKPAHVVPKRLDFVEAGQLARLQSTTEPLWRRGACIPWLAIPKGG